MSHPSSAATGTGNHMTFSKLLKRLAWARDNYRGLSVISHAFRPVSGICSPQSARVSRSPNNRWESFLDIAGHW